MMFKVCKRREVGTFLPKYGVIFLILSVSVIIFALKNVDFQEFKVNSTVILQKVSSDPFLHHRFCTFQPLTTEDAQEQDLILDSIAWPETPALVSLERTSDPAHSYFTILPKKGGGQWHVGDQLEVMIKMYDFQGERKKSGGDFLIARLHNWSLGAGVAGHVVDHLNGCYSAVFTLLWERSAEVQVTLVHSSEAITVLQKLTSEQPDRIYFKSDFRSDAVSEHTTCNVCLRPTLQPVCNYTDLQTGDPWFCYKPEKLNCNTRITHSKGGFKQNLTAGEQKLFQGGVTMKVPLWPSGPSSVTVMPKRKEEKNSSVKIGNSGYYYQGAWRALGGTPVLQFNTSSAISNCLAGKTVHLYGDSTIRQWFEHLTAVLPDLKEYNLGSLKQVGPFMALDYANRILVTYRCHGPPIRFANVPTSKLRYIANELDRVTGGSNTIIVLGIWSHFSTFPIEVYIRRLQSIRRAVVRLLHRAPSTLVVIRTANLKALTLYETLTNSDWYSLQCDKVLRAVFKGLNVRLVDAWEMGLAHQLPHSLHPQPIIIKNMINVLLSYICPEKDELVFLS
ncbi:NXPE family member 3-like isoform X2 [Echeneis naucrates]|uniref:NXPE family member 3-like n=1 Tax=Echeneis naucrates TaxID=173247 RepID=A0A665VD45_ECHNA|nr:NXPE family member 3-like isoform X2 [Echeneis naucrates]